MFLLSNETRESVASGEGKEGKEDVLWDRYKNGFEVFRVVRSGEIGG